jgi:hypothetical protein
LYACLLLNKKSNYHNPSNLLFVFCNFSSGSVSVSIRIKLSLSHPTALPHHSMILLKPSENLPKKTTQSQSHILATPWVTGLVATDLPQSGKKQPDYFVYRQWDIPNNLYTAWFHLRKYLISIILASGTSQHRYTTISYYYLLHLCTHALRTSV